MEMFFKRVYDKNFYSNQVSILSSKEGIIPFLLEILLEEFCSLEAAYWQFTKEYKNIDE